MPLPVNSMPGAGGSAFGPMSATQSGQNPYGMAWGASPSSQMPGLGQQPQQSTAAPIRSSGMGQGSIAAGIGTNLAHPMPGYAGAGKDNPFTQQAMPIRQPTGNTSSVSGVSTGASSNYQMPGGPPPSPGLGQQSAAPSSLRPNNFSGAPGGSMSPGPIQASSPMSSTPSQQSSGSSPMGGSASTPGGAPSLEGSQGPLGQNISGQPNWQAWGQPNPSANSSGWAGVTVNPNIASAAAANTANGLADPGSGKPQNGPPGYGGYGAAAPQTAAQMNQALQASRPASMSQNPLASNTNYTQTSPGYFSNNGPAMPGKPGMPPGLGR